MQVSRKGAGSAPLVDGGVAGVSDSLQNGAVFDDLLLAMLGTNGTSAFQGIAHKSGPSEASTRAVASANSFKTTAQHAPLGGNRFGESTGGKLAGSGEERKSTAGSEVADALDLASMADGQVSADEEAGVVVSLVNADKNPTARVGLRGAKSTTDIASSPTTSGQNPGSGVRTSDSAGLTTPDLRVATLLSKANHTSHRESSTGSETSRSADERALSPATGESGQLAAVTAGAVESNASLPAGQTSKAVQVDVRQPDALSQFGQLISVKADAGNSKLQVQILPQGMGQLGVTVTKGADGLQIQVVASQAATFAWLNQQMPALQQNLQELGLNVSNFQLSYGQSDAQTGGEGQRQQQPSPERSSSAPRASGDTLTAAEAVAATPVQHRGDISLSI
ncbi:flagellar hook-length control protein FliK [Alicyclobacillus fastidiosus]|uniref:Flagellar hook-length control protein FliK n=1 Tax=Alicyclobacillus fastidiosus TaxID=392011 RepID=A0ABY6ZD86_9BACL|nr:flagellar hook-length control protein FliK [Alicyclobacillus fastidiosus]WAH40206.1 flagellar hook-length control protein FliK [Alicyclobacillus fastidiosus]GMA61563.1 hypothetical protein GCM10025859_20030 [Alicyclobacillus fastidiosus]